MKNAILFRLFSAGMCICLLAACKPQTITIEGIVKNAPDEPIVYYATADGIYNGYAVDTLRMQPDSSFTITIPARGKEKVNFYLWGVRPLGTVYLKPGSSKIVLDLSESDALTTERAAGEIEALKTADRIDADVWDLRTRQGDRFDIRQDTVASSVYEKLTGYARSLEAGLTGLDADLNSKIVRDIRMHALLAFESQYMTVFYGSPEPTDSAKQAWRETFGKMVEFVRIDHPDLVFSPAFADAVRNWASIRTFLETASRPAGQNELNRTLFDYYEQHLPQGRVQEAAMAFIFLEDKAEERYTTGLPALYDRFKTFYPQSALMPAVEQAMETNRAFNRAELTEDIRILPTDSIRSFQELISRYAGKVVFIDIWATWCSPCRRSFAHFGPLQQYAREHDIVLLYISIDQARNADLWKKMVAYYRLQGDHAIINDAYQQDIYDLFGKAGRLAVPHHAIVDTKGEIRFVRAADPATMDRLIPQLEAAAE